MYSLVWISASTLLYSLSFAVELPEKPHNISDGFSNKLNAKGGEYPNHIGYYRIPRLKNGFEPSYPSTLRSPKFPPKHHKFGENNERIPFRPDIQPPALLGERKHKSLASSSRPSLGLVDPNYEHSDFMKIGVSEKPHNIFDGFSNKLNAKGGEYPNHIGYYRIPRLKNGFEPSYPSSLRSPKFPPKHHEFGENNGRISFRPHTQPPAFLGEGKYKSLASSSTPSQGLVNPNYEHSDFMNIGGEISREAKENQKDLEQFQNVLNDYQKRLFLRNEISHRLSPYNLSPSALQIGTNNEDRKHFGNVSNEFASRNHLTQDNFGERSKSSLVPRSELQNLLLNPLEMKKPVPGFRDVKHIPSHVNKIHTPSKIEDELRRIKDFLSQPLRKSEFPNPSRIINDEKKPIAVELDLSEFNETYIDRVVLRTLLRELPTRPDVQKIYKLKLLVKPPNNFNGTFVRNFVILLRNITTNLIPNAITGAKLTAFKKNNETLPIFQVNLYIKYLNRWIVRKPTKTNDTYDIASEKILSNENETLIELETNKNNTMEIAKINLDKLTSNYKETLKSVLYELLKNTTRSDGYNKSIVLISIKLPNHRSFDLTDSLFKTSKSVMCEVAPDLITFDNFKLPQGKNRHSPSIEILIPIQEKNYLDHLPYLNLTHSYGNLHVEIFKRVSIILNVVTSCQPKNSTINFNFTMFLPKNESTESIRNILQDVTNIARQVLPHHRIYIETQTTSFNNTLKLQLNITMKPSEINANHKGIEKEISIDLRRTGSSMVPKIRMILPALVREIEKSSKPISLIFNISFPLGMNKDSIRAEIFALVSLLEEAIPVEYGTIANVILQITVIPAKVFQDNAIIRNIKLHEYEESLIKTTEPFTSVEYTNATENNSSSSNDQDILERNTELYPSFRGLPGITLNKNPLLKHIPKISYPRWRTPPINAHKTPNIFEKPHLVPLRHTMYRRLHLLTQMIEQHRRMYRRPVYSYLPNKYGNFRKYPHPFQKQKSEYWRRPVNPTNFMNFASTMRWPQMTTINSNVLKPKATTISPSSSVDNWAESREIQTSTVYHTPSFHFPIWERISSATHKIPSPFEEIPEINERFNLPSYTTSRYERFASQSLRNGKYPTHKFREPRKFYRHLENKYDEFLELPSHLKKHLLRYISTSWRTPLHEENIRKLSSKIRWPRTTGASEKSTLETETSTTSFSNSVENWTESEKIQSTSSVYHTPKIYRPINLPLHTTSPYERSTETSNGQSFYRYLKHKYHKFHKLPHHLKKKILKKIQSSWKKPINEKKIKKFLENIVWPSMWNTTTKSTTFETSSSTSSNLFQISTESEEISTTPNVLEIFNISSTNFNSLLTTPTSETTVWSTITTPSNHSISSVETTTTLMERTTIPTVLSSASQTESTIGVKRSEASSTENETKEYLKQSSTAVPNETFDEYTTTYPTSNEATINSIPKYKTFPTSYPAYAYSLPSYKSVINEISKESTPGNSSSGSPNEKYLPNEYQIKESNVLLPAQEISPSIPTTNEHIKRVLESSSEMYKTEEPFKNIIPDNITPETAPFLDNGLFRNIPKFTTTKLRKRPLNWLPKNFTPRKIKWPNVSTKENSIRNNLPRENSIEESLTSRTSNGGEVIDKETSLQFFENGHFSVKKRTLNFSNSNSNLLSQIERNVLSVLSKNENEPTILLFKIIPHEGMMVSDLRNLTESLITLLITDFPRSEINIVTKAYYDNNQQIKLMKMKIKINYSNEKTKNDSQLEENIYFVKYLRIIIHKILKHIEMNSSGQQILQFNFTIDYPSDVSKSVNSNLIKSLEAILSQMLPYENVDITSSITQSNSNITSSLVNVIITPTSKTNSIIEAPVIHLDGLSSDHLKHKIQHFVLKNVLHSTTSDQNISTVINFAFETNKVTSFDIIGLENSISDILDEMQIIQKFLPSNARLELNNKDGIIIEMPFSITTTKKDMLMYLKNGYNSKTTHTKNVRPVGKISDLILED